MLKQNESRTNYTLSATTSSSLYTSMVDFCKSESLFKNWPRKGRTKASCKRDLRDAYKRERRRGWKKMVDEECRIEILSRFARFDSKQSLYIPNQWIREILGNDWKKFTRENIRWNSLNSSCSKNKRSYCTNNNIYNRSKGSLQELRVSYNNLLGKLRLQFLQFLFKFIL